MHPLYRWSLWGGDLMGASSLRELQDGFREGCEKCLGWMGPGRWALWVWGCLLPGHCSLGAAG